MSRPELVTLIDLVDTSEWNFGQLLQGHHVEGGGDGLLSPTLCALAELLQGLSLSEPHLDLDSVTSKLCLLVSLTEADLTVVTLKYMLMILLMRVRLR